MTEPAYGALSLPQRRLYRELQRNVESFQTEYVFQNTTFEEIGKVFQAVLADHPGYFWLSGSSAGTVRKMGSSTTVYYLSQVLSEQYPNLAREETDKISDRVLDVLENRLTIEYFDRF